jgi:hypothetical protein
MDQIVELMNTGIHIKTDTLASAERVHDLTEFMCYLRTGFLGKEKMCTNTHLICHFAENITYCGTTMQCNKAVWIGTYQWFIDQQEFQ